MAVFSITSSLVVLFTGLYILHALPNCGRAQNISTEIIHPESPLYDPTSTPSSRSGAAVHRSAFRSANSNNYRILAAPDSNWIYLNGTGYDGRLLVKLGLGPPNQTTWVTVSTTGDFGWVMCIPCETCNKTSSKLFNPSGSSTYKTVPCISNGCDFRTVPCLNDQANCTYRQVYGRKLIAMGILSKETLYFHGGSTGEVIVPEFIFGCTHQIIGEKPEKKISGTVVLNNKKFSLNSQLFYKNGIPRKFSFCIPLKGNISRIYLGNTPPTNRIIYTAHLFIGSDNLLYVRLKDFSTRINPWQIAVEQDSATPVTFLAPPAHSRNVDYIIIDSATPMTFIHDNKRNKVLDKILARFRNKRASIPEYLRPEIDLCLDWSVNHVAELPILDFYLSEDALIYGREAFVDVGNDVYCLFIASTNHSKGVQKLGSRVMSGHRFEIDLQENVVNIENGEFGRCHDR